MMDVSVILPCYNSAFLVEKRVRDFENVLTRTRWSWEILLCDDGSRDGTAAICQRLAQESQACRFFPASANRGRGKNVCDGILQSRGTWVGFADVDFSTDAIYLIPILQALESGYSVAEANRTYKLRFTHFPFIFHRFSAHLVYATLVRLCLGIEGHDTETGFKFFRREAALQLIAMSKAQGWFWDTEVIANAHALKYSVAEIPSLFIRTKGMGSTVRLLQDSWTQFRSLMRLAYHYRGHRLRGACCR